MKKLYLIILLFFITNFSILAFANDTSGTTGAGGITFSKISQISIDREDLNITPTQIKVSYLFKNNSEKDISTQVFFPLPPFQLKGANANWDNEVSTTNPAQAPFLNFSISVQGNPIKYETVTRAMLKGQDISKQLQAAGIPLNPDLVAGKILLPDAKTAPAWQEKAKQLGFLDANNQPLWKKQTVFFWTQNFPAQQEILIEHTYKPAAGMFYSAAQPAKPLSELMPETAQRIQDVFGINLENLTGKSDLTNWLAQRFQQNLKDTNGVNAYFYNINYILTTGANWGGPIKNFSLTITKPADGVIAYNKFYDKRTANIDDYTNSISFFIKNFIPQRDLQIVFASASQLV